MSAEYPPDFWDWPEAKRNAWYTVNGAGLAKGDYPQDFWLWSPEKRNEYFAAEAKRWRNRYTRRAP